jgi:hypothetical protein
MDEKTIALPGIQTYIKTFLPAVAFSIPFIFSGPQLITGTIVNCLLLLTSFNYSKKITWPVLLLPSLGALMHGMVFGQFTPFLIFFIPAIWIGNFLLVSSFAFFSKSFSPVFSLFASSLLKTFLLYLLAIVFFNFSLVPKIFIGSMGTIQFVTAIIGGALALGINRTWTKKIS